MVYSRLILISLFFLLLTSANELSAAGLSAAEEAFERGQVAAEQGSWKIALRYFKKAHRLAPRAPQFLYALGVAHQKRKDSILAMVFYKAYLEAVPKASNRKQVEKQILKEEIYLDSLVDELLWDAWELSKQIPEKATLEQEDLIRLKWPDNVSSKIREISRRKVDIQMGILNSMIRAGQLESVKILGLRHPEYHVSSLLRDEILEIYRKGPNYGIGDFDDAISLSRKLSFSEVEYFTGIYDQPLSRTVCFGPNIKKCRQEIEDGYRTERKDWDANKEWRVSLEQGLSLIPLSNTYWRFEYWVRAQEIYREAKDLIEKSLAGFEMDFQQVVKKYYRTPGMFSFHFSDTGTYVFLHTGELILKTDKETGKIHFIPDDIFNKIEDCIKIMRSLKSDEFPPLICASSPGSWIPQVHGGTWMEIIQSGRSPGKTKFLIEDPIHTDLLGRIEQIKQAPVDKMPLSLASLALSLARSAYFVKHN